MNTAEKLAFVFIGGVLLALLYALSRNAQIPLALGTPDESEPDFIPDTVSLHGPAWLTSNSRYAFSPAIPIFLPSKVAPTINAAVDARAASPWDYWTGN